MQITQDFSGTVAALGKSYCAGITSLGTAAAGGQYVSIYLPVTGTITQLYIDRIDVQCYDASFVKVPTSSRYFLSSSQAAPTGNFQAVNTSINQPSPPLTDIIAGDTTTPTPLFMGCFETSIVLPRPILITQGRSLIVLIAYAATAGAKSVYTSIYCRL